MTWNKKWQCCFRSRLYVDYAVNIYENDYSGDVVRLTGAENPFETFENNDSNIFAPVRGQSGYLRVIDETGGNLLESMMPVNNTQYRVLLYRGYYDADSDIFTESEICWHGFMCAEVFTQPWDAGKSVLEFPVKSYISALADVQIPNSISGQTIPLANLIVGGMEALLGSNYAPYSYVYQIDCMGGLFKWMTCKVDMSTFFTEGIVNNQGVSINQISGTSYLDALSQVMSAFGLMMREAGNYLCFAHYDKNGLYMSGVRTSWSNIVSIAGGSGASGSVEDVSDIDIMNAVEFRSMDNTLGFMQGGRSAAVVFNIKSYIKTLLSVPSASESDPSAPYEITIDLGNSEAGKLYIQPQTPRETSFEHSLFYKMNVARHDEYLDSVLIYSCWEYTFNSVSDYATFLNHSLMLAPTEELTDGGNLYTGACPCRFFLKKSNEYPTLASGLYFSMESIDDANLSYQKALWSISYVLTESVNRSLSNGYLQISMNALNVYRNNSQWNLKDDFKLYFVLNFAGKYWNGMEWISEMPDRAFSITFEDGEIVTNKSESMDIDENSGYFIPVEGSMTGTLVLSVYCVVNSLFFPSPYINFIPYDSRPVILSDVCVNFIRTRSVVASERSENAYRANILSSGFSEDKETKLEIGTNNNNVPAPCFLQDDDGYISSFEYYSDSSTTFSQRPEMNLLDRMVAYFGQVRRRLKAVTSSNYLLSSTEILTSRFSYLSKVFFAVDSKHNWSDDEQDIDFFEIT